jgi:hypothetical protein
VEERLTWSRRPLKLLFQSRAGDEPFAQSDALVERFQQAAITEPLMGVGDFGSAQSSFNVDPAHPVGVVE